MSLLKMVGLLLTLMNDYFRSNLAVFPQTIGYTAVFFMRLVYNPLYQLLRDVSLNVVYEMDRCEIARRFIITSRIHVYPNSRKISFLETYYNIYY